jgi:amino acid transporter
LATGKVFVREATGLVRQFSTLDALLIATGMIFPLEAATLQFPYYFGFDPGADLSVALLIAAGPMVVLMLAYWAMGVIMPRAGNDYVWTGRVFGPLVGFTWSAYYTFAVFGGGYVVTATAVAYALSTSLSVGGVLYNSPALVGAGTWFSAPIGEFLLAEAFTVIIFLVTLVGRATGKVLLYIGWLSALVGIAIMWFLLGTTDPTTFAAKWNTAFSQYTSYDGMVKAASGAGWSATPITFAASVAGVPLAVLFYLGGNYVNGVAGEVRDVKKALPISLLVSLLFGMIFWIGTAILIVGTTSYNWLSAVGYLYDTNSAA